MAGPSVYRRQLIEAGKLTAGTARVDSSPSNCKVLRLDEVGAREAKRHIEQGERGAKVMSMPLGLSAWHEDARAAQERKRSK